MEAKERGAAEAKERAVEAKERGAEAVRAVEVKERGAKTLGAAETARGVHSRCNRCPDRSRSNTRPRVRHRYRRRWTSGKCVGGLQKGRPDRTPSTSRGIPRQEPTALVVVQGVERVETEASSRRGSRPAHFRTYSSRRASSSRSRYLAKSSRRCRIRHRRYSPCSAQYSPPLSDGMSWHRYGLCRGEAYFDNVCWRASCSPVGDPGIHRIRRRPRAANTVSSSSECGGALRCGVAVRCGRAVHDGSAAPWGRRAGAGRELPATTVACNFIKYRGPLFTHLNLL